MSRLFTAEDAFFATTSSTKWRVRILSYQEKPEGWLKNGGIVSSRDDAQVFDSETEAVEVAKLAGFVNAG